MPCLKKAIIHRFCLELVHILGAIDLDKASFVIWFDSECSTVSAIRSHVQSSTDLCGSTILATIPGICCFILVCVHKQGLPAIHGHCASISYLERSDPIQMDSVEQSNG